MAKDPAKASVSQVPSVSRGRQHRVIQALAGRDFRLLLVGTFLTQGGHWSYQIGQGWLVYELTGSPLQLGLVSMFMGLGMFCVGPVAGGLADRFDRTKLMSASQGLILFVALGATILVMLDAIAVWHIYLIALLVGSSFAINGPTRNSLVYDLVGEEALPNAIGVYSAVTNSMRIVGPSIGGFMLGVVGVEGTYMVQAAAYLAAMVTALMMRPAPRPPVTERRPLFQAIGDGLAYARQDKTIMVILASTVVGAFFGMAYVQLMPAFAGEVLSLSGSQFGYLMVSLGVGGVLGSLVAAGIDLPRRGLILLLSIMAAGALQIIFASIGNVGVTVVALVGLGAAGALMFTLGNILIQTNVQDEYRGRVSSLYFMTFSLYPLGVLVGGAIAEGLGLQPAMILMGGLVAGLVGVIAIFSPVRRL